MSAGCGDDNSVVSCHKIAFFCKSTGDLRRAREVVNKNLNHGCRLAPRKLTRNSNDSKVSNAIQACCVVSLSFKACNRV